MNNQIQLFIDKLEKDYKKQKTVKDIRNYTEALLYLNMLKETYKKFPQGLSKENLEDILGYQRNNSVV